MPFCAQAPLQLPAATHAEAPAAPHSSPRPSPLPSRALLGAPLEQSKDANHVWPLAALHGSAIAFSCLRKTQLALPCHLATLQWTRGMRAFILQLLHSKIEPSKIKEGA